jgi:hypothetical protein
MEIQGDLGVLQRMMETPIADQTTEAEQRLLENILENAATELSKAVTEDEKYAAVGAGMAAAFVLGRWCGSRIS